MCDSDGCGDGAGATRITARLLSYCTRQSGSDTKDESAIHGTSKIVDRDTTTESKYEGLRCDVGEESCRKCVEEGSRQEGQVESIWRKDDAGCESHHPNRNKT